MNSKPEILLLAPLPQFLLGPLWEACICHSYFMTEHKKTLLAEAGPRIRGIVMAGGSQAPVELLEKLPALEIISVFGVGYDGVPVEYCRQRGIHVTNTPDVLTDDVADIAVGLILMTSRRLAQAERYVRAQQWPRAPFPLAHSLRGKTAGILGLGRMVATHSRTFLTTIATASKAWLKSPTFWSSPAREGLEPTIWWMLRYSAHSAPMEP